MFVLKSMAVMALICVFGLNSFATNYYSKSTGNLNSTATWGINTDGTGTAPTNFTAANQVFNIRNNAAPTIAAAWAVSGTSSKVIVGDGTNACNFTIPSGFAMTGTIDVSANATLTIANTTIPTLSTLDVASTVVYSGTSSQTVKAVTYGNLKITNTSTALFTTNCTVAGDFTLAGGASGIFRVTNGRTLTITGDFIGTSGTYDYTSSNNGASTINLSGNFSNTGVVFNGSGNSADGTLIFAGAGTIASPQTFTNSTASNITNTSFTVNTGTVVQLNSTLPLDRVDATGLTVSGTLNMQGFSTSVTGASGTSFATISGGGTLITSNAGGLTGAIPSTNTTISFSTTGNYEFDTGALVTGSTFPTTVNNLTINTTGTVASSQGVGVTGVLSITGTFNMGTANRITSVGSISGTGTLQTQVPTATSPLPIPAGKTWSVTVEYGAATAQTVMQGTYSNGITFNGAGTKTFTAGTNNIGGDWNSSGGKVDVTTNSAVINFTGTVAQAITDAGSNSGAGVEYGTVNFSGAGTKTFSGQASVKTNWTSTGGKIDLTTNSVTLIFTGTAAQDISDAGSDGGNGIQFYNVNFSGGGTKTLSSGNFKVSTTGTLTMSGSTTLATGGNLILDSDAGGSATVAAIPSGASITGSVNVKRFFTGGAVATQRAYRLVSSPVNTNDIVDNSTPTSYFTMSGTTDLYTGGPGGIASGFTVTNAGTSTVFLYREDTPPITTNFNYGNYKGIFTLNTTPFPVTSLTGTYTLWAGNAMMIYYVGSISSNTTFNTKSGSVYPNPDNTTASFIGTLNQGTIPVKLWYNSSTSFSYTSTGAAGYYLVGNPYASTIDLNTFSNAASDPGTGIWGGPLMSNIFYIYDYSSKHFNAYTVGAGGTGNATRYIASGQGFFAKSASASAGGQLVFHEGAKTTASNNPTGSNLLMGAPAAANQRQSLHLKVSQDAINNNDILVIFGPDTKDTYENNIDADYFNGIGSTISISTFAKNSGIPLVINQMHSIDSTTRVRIKIGSTISGVDTLSGSGFEKLDPRYPAYLVDHYKNNLSIPFTSATKYVFNINLADTTTYGSGRFELVFRKDSTLTHYKLLSFTAAKSTMTNLKMANSGIVLTWKVENEGKFTGFTLERADGSLQFMPIYSLQSDGSGTYTYTDKTPLAGVNKYRLMQNGAFDNITYSDIITVGASTTANDDKLDKIKLYPNPVVNQLHVTIGDNPPATVHITVMSSSGYVMISKDVSSSGIDENVSKLFPGVYTVEISDVTTKKVIGRKKFVKL